MEILLDDPTNENAQRAVAELDRYAGYFVHPSQQQEIRRNVQKLAYYDCEVGVPKAKWPEEISGKIRFSPGPGATDAEFFAFKAEVHRAVISEITEERTYRAETIHDALSQVRNEIPSDHLVSIKISGPGGLATVEGAGDTADGAIETAKESIPPHAFNVGAPALIEQSQSRVLEVEALIEEEAPSRALQQLPAGCPLATVNCQSRPRCEFLGIGKRPGIWTVRYRTPFRAKISFQPPPQVTVSFWSF
jgi:hypothetical protein